MPCIVTLHSSKDSLKIHITPELQRRETKRQSHASRKKWERTENRGRGVGGGGGRGKWMREEREVGEIGGNYGTMLNISQLEAKKTGALRKGIAKTQTAVFVCLA